MVVLLPVSRDPNTFSRKVIENKHAFFGRSEQIHNIQVRRECGESNLCFVWFSNRGPKSHQFLTVENHFGHAPFYIFLMT